ncbi:hypothetical protein OH492_29280 [Vibrio chagasii]|nr:hypothetical protein [Vibrio chagasii]
MSIYDHVIGGDAGHELQGIAIGAALLFVMMGWLRTLRSRVFASCLTESAARYLNPLCSDY